MLQEKLGVLLLQLPPTFGPDKFNNLKDFLSKLPQQNRYAIEVRNGKLLDEKLYSLLREKRIALVLIADSGLPEIDQITADFNYIRWEGDRTKVNGTLGRVEIDRTEDIKSWARKIIKILDQTKEVIGYFSKYYSGAPTADAKTLIDILDLHS